MFDYPGRGTGKKTEKLVIQHNLQDRVKFLGHIPKPISTMSCLTYLLIPPPVKDLAYR
jgi:hypothetical protein